MKTEIQFTKSDLGRVIDGSCDSADYINQETIQFASNYGFPYEELPDSDDEDYSQILSEVADDAINFLNDLDCPPYCSFYFEDNSLFFAPSIESAQEDVEFRSSRDQEYPADDYEGEWLHVNDHGNATLYVRENGEDTEIWSLV